MFDIDGTLIRWQLYHALATRLAKEGLLGERAYEELVHLRNEWKKRTHAESFKDYERRMVELYDASLINLPLASFTKAVNTVIEEHKDQVYVYTRELTKKLKAQGYFLLAISGSHHEMVEKIAHYYGFDDWIGSKYEVKNGAFTGKTAIPNHDKAKVLRTFIKKHDLDMADSYAVGDSRSDASMLEMVENPIAFNPDQQLFQIAKKHGWNIVIERKNVVYTLQSRDGSYLLAETNH